MDFENLASELLARSESLCREWFPAGKKRGHEYVVGDLQGSEGASLSINLNNGKWSDFATGESGGDFISLYAAREGMSQGDAYKQLTNGHAPQVMSRPAPAPKKPKQEKPAVTIIMPVPVSAPAPIMMHPIFGTPVMFWHYRNPDGETLGYIARYEPEGERKQIVPWVWADGHGWVMKQWPEPRPLYGLDLLAQNPDRPVMLVEGEKAADAARKIAGHIYVVVTWPGGSSAWQKADFSTLAGRKVLLWPDADNAGRKCMADISVPLLKICAEVKAIRVDGDDGSDAADFDGDYKAFAKWAKERVTTLIPPKATVGNGASSTQNSLPTAGAAAAQSPVPAPTGAGGVTAMDWRSILEGNNGGPYNNLDNAVRVLEYDTGIVGKIWYDEFLDRIVTTWQGPEREWKDADDLKLQLYLQRYIGLTKIGVQTCHDAALVAAFHNIRNECREYLESQKWDGVPRLNAMLHEAFGADDNAYSEAVGRCWFISMVARVMQPGCKVDTVPVLEGTQGKGKSTALSIIGGKWYVECHESVTSKDFYGVLDGHMIVEIAEMHSFTRAEVERIKGIISCQKDRYRKSYGRNTQDHPRKTVLACTTNRDDWQRDETGARRFWPVFCREINHEWLRTHRDQLFAEAVALYREGCPWWDVPVDAQRAEVEKRRDVDAWEPVIEDWVAGRDKIQTHTILADCLQIDISKHDKVASNRVGRIMRLLNFEYMPCRMFDGKVKKAWVRRVT